MSTGAVALAHGLLQVSTLRKEGNSTGREQLQSPEVTSPCDSKSRSNSEPWLCKGSSHPGLRRLAPISTSQGARECSTKGEVDPAGGSRGLPLEGGGVGPQAGPKGQEGSWLVAGGEQLVGQEKAHQDAPERQAQDFPCFYCTERSSTLPSGILGRIGDTGTEKTKQSREKVKGNKQHAKRQVTPTAGGREPGTSHPHRGCSPRGWVQCWATGSLSPRVYSPPLPGSVPGRLVCTAGWPLRPPPPVATDWLWDERQGNQSGVTLGAPGWAGSWRWVRTISCHDCPVLSRSPHGPVLLPGLCGLSIPKFPRIS